MKKPRAPRPPKFNPLAARKEALSLASEIHLHAPLKHPQDLSPDWEDIPHNTQVGRFMLLNHLLNKASFCAPEIQLFLSKYIHTLTPPDLTQLRLHLPNVTLLHRRDFFKYDPSLRGIQQLGPRHGPGRFPDTYYLGQALLFARQHVICDPTSFCNVDITKGKGWFLTLASNLSHAPVFAENENGVRVYSHRAPSFWFGELENAVWLSIIVRLTLLSSNDPFLAKNQLAIKEAWRSFFGTFSPPSKFNKGNSNTAKNGCTCPDKGRYVLTGEEYFRTIRPAHLHTSHSGLEISLLKTLKAIDAVPENSKFKLEDLYTAVLAKVEEGIVTRECTVRPARKNVFHQVHWTPEVVKIVEEKLPKLTLDAVLEVEKFNIRDFGCSARQKAGQANGKK